MPDDSVTRKKVKKKHKNNYISKSPKKNKKSFINKYFLLSEEEK